MTTLADHCRTSSTRQRIDLWRFEEKVVEPQSAIGIAFGGPYGHGNITFNPAGPASMIGRVL